MSRTLTATYHTLGCKLNFAETSALASQLEEAGVRRAAPGETPALVVVNTCSVTAAADKKCRQLIARLHRRWPEATIVATGCYAQLNPRTLGEMPGVGIVLGSAEKLQAVGFVQQWLRTAGQPVVAAAPTAGLREFRPSCERGDRTRWYLKVQDGCDRFCSYCTIPLARGRSRSPEASLLVEQARAAAAAGAREIILTGVNIGDFGRHGSESFFDLCRRLDEVEGVERYRISSIEPDLLPPELIEWLARDSRAFMPHFHIPLQSGSDAVLRLMGRHYDTSLFGERIRAVRELMPHAFIGVDVIAGARGETPREWERGLAFIESLPLTRLHVFPYSERPGTRALGLPDAVDPAERRRRAAVLNALSSARLAAFAASQEGTVRRVLWERCRAGEVEGLTDNYLRVSARGDRTRLNTVTDTELLSAVEERLTGRILP